MARRDVRSRGAVPRGFSRVSITILVAYDVRTHVWYVVLTRDAPFFPRADVSRVLVPRWFTARTLSRIRATTMQES